MKGKARKEFYKTIYRHKEHISVCIELQNTTPVHFTKLRFIIMSFKTPKSQSFSVMRKSAETTFYRVLFQEIIIPLATS